MIFWEKKPLKLDRTMPKDYELIKFFFVNPLVLLFFDYFSFANLIIFDIDVNLFGWSVVFSQMFGKKLHPVWYENKI